MFCDFRKAFGLDPEYNKQLEEVGAMVRYILDDKFIGLAEGYVALGLQILT